MQKITLNMTQIRPRLSGAKKAMFEHFTKKESRVLVIGDLHAPFDLDNYYYKSQCYKPCSFLYFKVNNIIFPKIS